MRQDDRAPFLAALDHARRQAYPPGEYVGQESFMRVNEILELARRAGIGRDVSVLDLCCGVAGPGRLIASEFRCRYMGVDYSASALELARASCSNLDCRFEQMHVPPLPDEYFDVVLLLETMLAFRDKPALFAEVSRALRPGGRFAFTLEEGGALTPQERLSMPDADTVWIADLAEVTAALHAAGLTLRWTKDCSASHLATATALTASFRAESAQIAPQIGLRALNDLISAHQLWSDWLGTGRVHKFACVAEKR